MEFNTNKRDALDEAVKPRAIKAQTQNWTLLEGYVYVISKKMPIKQNGKMLNCVKIGMSNLNTREGFDKSYTRLLNFRTTLVSYNLHRIYLFTANDNDANDDEPMGLSAYNAEQTIHKLIDNKFKPKQLRIQFPNGGKRVVGCEVEDDLQVFEVHRYSHYARYGDSACVGYGVH